MTELPSFWLETAGDDLQPRPPLGGSTEVDVAVLGAGYSGLWTAYYLLQRDPSLRIAVLEAEFAGFGASGRNGGWCSSGFPLSAGVLVERVGEEAARALLLELAGAVDEVGLVCEREGIDAQFHKGGALRIARGAHQLPAIKSTYAGYERLGLADGYRLLNREQTEERVRVTRAEGALAIRDCASIHPGRLVRGLARTVERMGATIYEGTEVVEVRTGSRPSLVTRGGEVRARTVVLAGEAYLTRLPGWRRRLLPIYSLIVLTEPLTDEQWARIGWEGRECISSNRFTVDYLQRTADGRILFGSRGAPYHYASRIEGDYDRHEPTHAAAKAAVEDWFPCLRGVRFTHTWGGPVGMPRDWMPAVSFDPSTGVAWAGGYTGQGVAASNLAGRILTDLIGGVESPPSSLPIVNHRSPPWEPEPLRWLAVRSMQRAFLRLDERAERTGQAPTGRTLTERLGRH